MPKHFVASTLTASQSYTVYDKENKNVVKSILINGGNSLVNRHLQTLEGAITEVSDADMSLLLVNPTFKRHVANGFIKISGQDDAAKATSDLESRDGGAPMQQPDVDKLLDDNNIDVPVDFDDPQESGKPTRKPRVKK